MNYSILIAQFVGPIYLAIGLGILLGNVNMKKLMDDFMKSDGLMYLGGLMAFAFGIAVLRVHNVWVQDWTVIITIFGWLSLIKGVTLVAFPNKMREFSKKLVTNQYITFATWFTLIIGGFLTYVSYF